jgi:hypothetical protein
MSIGKLNNPLSQLSPQAERSRSQSMPTNGHQDSTDELKLATRLTGDVLPVEIINSMIISN